MRDEERNDSSNLVITLHQNCMGILLPKLTIQKVNHFIYDNMNNSNTNLYKFYKYSHRRSIYIFQL